MTFLELLHGAEVLSQSGNPGISGLDYDSRRVKQGYLFVAMRGESSDGNQFIDKAIAAGAVAIVTDSDTEKPRHGVAWAQVSHGRRALARLSSNFYKRPAERLAVTGITGTNGKSTTTFLVEAILAASGRKNALIGTIEYHVAGKVLPAPHTTPEALYEVAVGRGIARELESLRDRFRKEALRRRWPRERIESVLHRREELRDLGVLEGLEREVAVRAGVIWTSLQGKRDALELFAKKLRLSREDAVRLRDLLALG